ncbi:MAG: TetR/AcrR family transcriptional regulator [Ilumatobacteraceae bacterium]
MLDATLRRLARDGFAGLSLASVAADAGTSRPAIYRRWPDKESLVVDAIARLAEVAPPAIGCAPFDDLVAELEHFRHCIEAAALPLAGLMLGDEVSPVAGEVPRPVRRRAGRGSRHALRCGSDDGTPTPTPTSPSPARSSRARGTHSRHGRYGTEGLGSADRGAGVAGLRGGRST